VFPVFYTKIKIYSTIILSVVLYGCETWSLKLREKYRLRFYEIRALRGIFGSARERKAGNGGNCTLGSFVTS
jgi:hypothetical protein